MAPKRSNHIEVPPAASTSEEDEEANSEDEEVGSSSEDEEDNDEPQTQSTPLIQKSPPPRKPESATAAVGNEGSESGSGSESESESESDTAMPNVRPLATKPMDDANVKKPRSNNPLSSSPVRACSSKRPGEMELDAKEANRPKKKAVEEGDNTVASAVEEVKKTGEDAKKQLFQRLFSEDDEIALLKGMLDYSAKRGVDPCADMNAFYDFVKKSIHTDVTKAQLMDKIRRLKKKFENNAGKGKKGEDRTFSKAHEQNAFELSKKIWGKEGISGKVESSAAKSNGKTKANNKAVVALRAELHSSPDKKVNVGVPMEVDKVPKSTVSSVFDKRFGVSSLEEEVLKHGLDMVDSEKKATLEARWRKLQISELELFIERSELVKEHAKLLLECYKSEDR
ncbi:RmlC-like cupins superfamily protein [Hibiscus syriacus]|uniref:RmlC-like cupins superfamily protein n=1 Tax=Hibiscus syriacus TaxID=106335 RepID=A0A6A2YPE3_HIBSY|nr:GLABROUS1 enhancer-binding protein-like [Hibiscus syriacus]KAE8681145.1 RmlC-like cupins superfamily protein [Hibiscus syriacus]